MNSGCFCCKLLTLFEQPFCATGSPMTDFTLFTRYIARESDYIIIIIIIIQNPSIKSIFRKIGANLNEPLNIFGLCIQSNCMLSCHVRVSE